MSSMSTLKSPRQGAEPTHVTTTSCITGRCRKSFVVKMILKRPMEANVYYLHLQHLCFPFFLIFTWKLLQTKRKWRTARLAIYVHVGCFFFLLLWATASFCLPFFFNLFKNYFINATQMKCSRNSACWLACSFTDTYVRFSQFNIFKTQKLDLYNIDNQAKKKKKRKRYAIRYMCNTNNHMKVM